jgi:hypothetical protein
MNRFEPDWAYLTNGMIPALVLTGVALCLAAGSFWLRADGVLVSQQQRQELEALEQQRVDLGNRLRARQQFEARFGELSAAGIVGEERRLGWAQTLRDIAADLQLPYLRYTAAPRRAFAAAYLSAGSPPVSATDMEVDAGLVHEGDLLRIFARLRDEAPGLVSVVGCTLERVSGAAAPELDKANVATNCRLRWFSIQIASAAAAMELE